MSLGLYDYDRRYRRRVWTGFIKFLLFVLMLLGVGVFAYEIGTEQFRVRDASMREVVNHLTRQKSELELLAQQFKQAQMSAEARVAELEGRLAREVPRGDLAKLVQLVTERMSNGVTTDRLAFVISAAQNRRNCQNPETKRFSPSTPIYKSPNRSVTFANGLITVTGDGQSKRDSNGDPEAWFDPAQPVTIRFISQGGKEQVAQGLLPLHYSIVIDNTEHRFSLVSGQRSFLEVTADRCPYP